MWYKDNIFHAFYINGISVILYVYVIYTFNYLFQKNAMTETMATTVPPTAVCVLRLLPAPRQMDLVQTAVPQDGRDCCVRKNFHLLPVQTGLLMKQQLDS